MDAVAMSWTRERVTAPVAGLAGLVFSWFIVPEMDFTQPVHVPATSMFVTDAVFGHRLAPIH